MWPVINLSRSFPDLKIILMIAGWSRWFLSAAPRWDGVLCLPRLEIIHIERIRSWLSPIQTLILSTHFLFPPWPNLPLLSPVKCSKPNKPPPQLQFSRLRHSGWSSSTARTNSGGGFSLRWQTMTNGGVLLKWQLESVTETKTNTLGLWRVIQSSGGLVWINPERRI